jgi:hypothetical protein
VAPLGPWAAKPPSSAVAGQLVSRTTSEPVASTNSPAIVYRSRASPCGKGGHSQKHAACVACKRVEGVSDLGPTMPPKRSPLPGPALADRFLEDRPQLLPLLRRRLLRCRVSDAGPSQLFARALRAGVRKPPRKEPAGRRAWGGVYGDLTERRLGREMR